MDLFEYMKEKQGEKMAPLASRLRPRTLDEIAGQEHILGKDKLLYRAIQADRISSIILFGPPGTGKTTIAKVIANTTKSNFRQINATVAGKKDMEEVVKHAKEDLALTSRKTILFIDEIHRFNKAQQDYLLPFVEDGTVVLVGATTENPFYEVNSALISRSRVFPLHPLSKEDISLLLNRALEDKERGLGSFTAQVSGEAMDFWAEYAAGDARSALNALELAVLTTPMGADGVIHVDLSVAQECIQKPALQYDQQGNGHYDTISAFIKSMRGSDPDGAMYYLAKMLYAGEDIVFIARRIMICAAEDVGLADPLALTVAVSACQAIERVGMPEARIILAQAANYVATAPKSNASYLAINKALEAVRKQPHLEVPLHLRNANYKGEKNLGIGVGYRYAHDYENHYVKQAYLPEGLAEAGFYEPTQQGYEARIQAYMKKIKGEVLPPTH